MWTFSDGTVAHLGGKIDGGSLFAQELREALSHDRLEVTLWPEPADPVELDLDDLMMFDTWLRNKVASPARPGTVKLVERPDDVPPVPDWVPPNELSEDDPDYDADFDLANTIF